MRHDWAETDGGETAFPVSLGSPNVTSLNSVVKTVSVEHNKAGC